MPDHQVIKPRLRNSNSDVDAPESEPVARPRPRQGQGQGQGQGFGGSHYQVVCSNCGQFGHVYRSCTYPVTSYGVICYRLVEHANSVRPEYLMVQRKDSMSFVEFVRGKYDCDNERYVGALLVNMTQHERNLLLSSDGEIDTLWGYLWRDLSHPTSHSFSTKTGSSRAQQISTGFAKDFDEAKSKFSGIRGSLPGLLKKYPSEVMETEWGFPKGRRNMNESDLECALREFQEETGLNPKHFSLLHNGTCMEEMFKGSNGVWYKHVYFVAKASPKMLSTCNESGQYPHRNGEIRSVAWFPFDQCLDRIRHAYPQRRNVLQMLHSSIIDSLQAVVAKGIESAMPPVRAPASAAALGMGSGFV